MENILLEKAEVVPTRIRPEKTFFISYSRTDLAAARRLFEGLQEIGADVAWFDKSDLKPGDPWEQAIRNAINGCYLFLPLVSANTEAREESFFREEWTLAGERARRIEGRKFIVPVVVDRDYDGNAGRFRLVPQSFLATHFGHAPEGDMSEELRTELTRLVRLAPNQGYPKERYKTASSDLSGEDRPPPSAIQNPRAQGALSRDTISKSQRERILQILNEERSEHPSTLDRDELVSRIGKSWYEIQPDVAYLEEKEYIVTKHSQIMGRIVHIPSITAKGVDFVDAGMQSSLRKGEVVRKIDVFISSPKDVYEERRIARRVIKRCNDNRFIADRYVLRPLAYEDDAPAEQGDPPQTVIDRHMKAGSSDLFICFFWHRMGTPVTVNGERFQSGTEYEYFDAYRNKQTHGKPYMLLYRGMKPFPLKLRLHYLLGRLGGPSLVELQQRKGVEAFFKRFEGEHSELKGNVKEYRSNEDFEEKLKQDIDTALCNNLIL